MQEGAGADPKSFERAMKAADKLGEAIARTTDKIMEMRKDIDSKQVLRCVQRAFYRTVDEILPSTVMHLAYFTFCLECGSPDWNA